MLKKKTLIISIVVALFIGGASTYIVMKEGPQVEQVSEPSLVLDLLESGQLETEEELAKVAEVYNLILKGYVEKVAKEKLVEGALHGMFAVLDDPDSIYMDEEMTEQFDELLESSFQGIGVELDVGDGKIVVIAPRKNSPAERAGLKPRDEIVAIDGEKIGHLNGKQASWKIRGEKGSTVTLEVQREGRSEPFTLAVVREEIAVETVTSELLVEEDTSIGYIEIAIFSETTAADFDKALRHLEEKKLDGLIIDVRGNPGGLLSGVQEILKGFVTDAKPYVQTETRGGEKSRYFSMLTKGKAYDVAVLIDEGSASAAEILASALHEAEGYPLIGTTTFGKGTIQQPVKLADGSSIKLTLLKWLTPNGNWIHRTGIEPTIEVKQPPIFDVVTFKRKERLVYHMNNGHVREVQKILDSLGFPPGRMDGYFDEETERAVRDFQEANKIETHGMIDEQTAAALNQAVLKEVKDPQNDAQLNAAKALFLK